MSKATTTDVLQKKGVLRNSSKFTGKHLCQRLFFDKVAGLRLFPVNFKKFLRAPFLIEHLWWLLLQCEEDCFQVESKYITS